MPDVSEKMRQRLSRQWKRAGQPGEKTILLSNSHPFVGKGQKGVLYAAQKTVHSGITNSKLHFQTGEKRLCPVRECTVNFFCLMMDAALQSSAVSIFCFHERKEEENEQVNRCD